jgi:hypothetical protein
MRYAPPVLSHPVLSPPSLFTPDAETSDSIDPSLPTPITGSTYMQNFLVEHNIIPSYLADVLMPPPEPKKLKPGKIRHTNKARVLTTQDILADLRMKEDKKKKGT